MLHCLLVLPLYAMSMVACHIRKLSANAILQLAVTWLDLPAAYGCEPDHEHGLPAQHEFILGFYAIGICKVLCMLLACT